MLRKPVVETRSKGRRVLAKAASETTPGVVYQIALEGSYVCTCPDSTNRLRDCKHMLAFLSGAIPERRLELGNLRAKVIMAQTQLAMILHDLTKVM